MFIVPRRKTIARQLVDSLDSHKEKCKADITEVMANGGLIHTTCGVREPWNLSQVFVSITFDKDFVLHVKMAG